MSETPLTFSQFHSQLDDTIIGYAALRRNNSYIMFDSAIVICESVEATKAWVAAYHPLELSTGMTFKPEVYAGIIRYQHEDPIPSLLDAGALKKFHETEIQDQRFHLSITETATEVGTLLESDFDFYEDSIAVLQPQVDRFIVGYALINTDNQFVQDASGCEVLIGRKPEAEMRAKAIESKILPLTEPLLLQHEDVGYYFVGDEVVTGKRRDLAYMQGYCDYMAEMQRDE